MKNQKRSVLIFKRETPKNARPWAFARCAQWLIRPRVYRYITQTGDGALWHMVQQRRI